MDAEASSGEHVRFVDGDTCMNALIGFESACERCISGFCEVTLLQGKATLQGAHLAKGVPVRMHAPLWGPAHKLQVLGSKWVKKKAALTEALSATGLTVPASIVSELVRKECGTIILYRGFTATNVEWMIAAEDLTRKFQDKRFKEGFVHTASSILGSAKNFTRAGLSVMSLPESWIRAVEVLANRDIKSAAVPIKTLVCGAKGVGKSTLLRYTVNTLLKQFPKVAVIDCDLGQSEMSPPGAVSLHVVSDPILMPSHLNMRDPELSYFVGDVSAKQDPGRLLSAVEALFAKYLKLQDRMNEVYREKVSTAAKGNVFAAFDSDTNKGRADFIPLVINTDGWIRYTGAEILASIVRMTSPTDILHLSTAKDRHLDSLKHLPDTCTLRTVEPGSTEASKTNASDLRTLRLVAYFLRYSQTLERLVSLPREIGTPFPLSIKYGALHDASGAAAFALVSSGVLNVPFSHLVLGFPGGAVPMRHLLSAMNASLVGLGPCEGTMGRETGTLAFDVKYDKDVALQPCVGLGIVRSFCLDEMRVEVHAPCFLQPKLMPPAGGKMCLLKGAIPLPVQLMCAPWAPVHPYCSGEMVGESGNVMKSRTNLKRRSQNNE